jgi:vacuolar-type H+-ATPase subunit I/STV1
MKKHLSSQNAPGGGAGDRRAPGGAAAQSHPKTDPIPSASTQQPAEGSAGSEKTLTAGGRTIKNNVGDLHPNLQAVVSRMLVEGSTVEDVVEALNERGGDGITLSAVQSYFQNNREIQKKRVRRLIEGADALLATVDKDPKSAEAQLARATFLTGYSRVRRDASLITPREAERFRLERENLSLRHQILIMKRKKATQELDYSRARTRLILLTQGKLQEEILKLQRECKGHRAGEPIGPKMLQRIQQIYGLACEPLLYEESANASAKA